MPTININPMPSIDPEIIAGFAGLPSTCAIADALSRDAVMAAGISSLWQPTPSIVGQAFTVHCTAGDNLMLHAAIHRAPAGSIIVVQSDAPHYALAGGNVCLVAQERGIKGFVLDGVIRDIAELREAKFPVFARGNMPKPGTKNSVTALNVSIKCGGVTVNGGDIIAADEEGIVVVAHKDAEQVVIKAREKAAKDAAQSLRAWREGHEAKIDSLLADSLTD